MKGRKNNHLSLVSPVTMLKTHKVSPDWVDQTIETGALNSKWRTIIIMTGYQERPLEKRRLRKRGPPRKKRPRKQRPPF